MSRKWEVKTRSSIRRMMLRWTRSKRNKEEDEAPSETWLQYSRLGRICALYSNIRWLGVNYRLVQNKKQTILLERGMVKPMRSDHTRQQALFEGSVGRWGKICREKEMRLWSDEPRWERIHLKQYLGWPWKDQKRVCLCVITITISSWENNKLVKASAWRPMAIVLFKWTRHPPLWILKLPSTVTWMLGWDARRKCFDGRTFHSNTSIFVSRSKRNISVTATPEM